MFTLEIRAFFTCHRVFCHLSLRLSTECLSFNFSIKVVQLALLVYQLSSIDYSSFIPDPQSFASYHHILEPDSKAVLQVLWFSHLSYYLSSHYSLHWASNLQFPKKINIRIFANTYLLRWLNLIVIKKLFFVWLLFCKFNLIHDYRVIQILSDLDLSRLWICLFLLFESVID